MIFLLGNIVFGSVFMLVIKWAHLRNREDIYTIGALNYISALLVFLPSYILNSDALNSMTSDPGATWTGFMMGACYFVGYFLVAFVVKFNGAAAAAVVSAMSLIVPILAGVAIWNESPSPMQIAGIVGSLLALVLISGSRQQTHNSDNSETYAVPQPSLALGLLMLGLFYAICGGGRLAQEAFKHLCEESERPTFIFWAFVTMAIPSIVMLLYRRRWISPTEWGMGLLMGVANILQANFMIMALGQLDGFVAFPIAGIGGLLLTAIIAASLIRESLSTKSKLGILMACFAVVLLNWQ